MNAQKIDDIGARLDALFQPWNRSDAPGLVVGIAHRDRTLYRRGFGLASIEHAAANTPATRMRIGSVTKQFAAFAALLLAEDGKLDLESPIRRYLPELVGPSGEPMLRQLLNHTGGIRDPYDLAGLLLARGSYNPRPAGTRMQIAPRLTTRNFAPGERMVYCNLGYELVSLAVERAGGMPFADFLSQRIFQPLGMSNTALLASDMDIVPNLATLHVALPGGGYRRGIYLTEELLGAGGMASTIDDMLAWLAHLRGERKQIGSAGSWRQMLERPRYSSGALGHYSLGLVHSRYRGLDLIHHAGGVFGGVCNMITAPAHELDIIVIANRGDYNTALAFELIDAVLGEAALAPPVAKASSKGREQLVGRWYAPQSRRSFAISEQQGLLHWSVLNLAAGPLDEIDGVLHPPYRNGSLGAVSIRPQSLAPGDPDTLEIIDSGHAERYERLPSTPPAAAELAPAIAGDYRYSELGVDVRMIMNGGVLELDLCPSYGRAAIVLEPFSAEVFGGMLVSSSMPATEPAVLTLERRDGKVTGFWLNGSRTRNLWFERCG